MIQIANTIHQKILNNSIYGSAGLLGNLTNLYESQVGLTLKDIQSSKKSKKTSGGMPEPVGQLFYFDFVNPWDEEIEMHEVMNKKFAGK